MKRRFLRIAALALALTLLCGLALAEVRTTASVNLRSGPGLSYEIVTSFSANKSLTYLGESSTDDRGVTWYKVSSGSLTGWVSSRYAKLVGEESGQPAPTAAPTPAPTAVPTPQPTPQPTAQPATDGQAGDDVMNAGGLFANSLGNEAAQPTAEPTAEPADGPALPDLSRSVELSAYYGIDLVTAANEIGLISYREVVSEAPYQYYDSALILAGNQTVESIVVYGSGYEVFGVSVGMDAQTAMACLNAAGLDYMDSLNGITYEHRAAEGAGFVDADGHDSCINLWVNAENIVTEIDWSTYTG